MTITCIAPAGAHSNQARPSHEETKMAKYLLQVCYTAEGAKGLIKDGGSARRAAAQKAAESLGGRLESFYFAFGDTDAYVLADMPDHASVAAITLALAASGATTSRTTVLLTPEEMDQATRKSPAYRAPGQ
ncbi:MAG: GYD domain-containing protein [Burkholderiales bacterium]|nr:GYD domain-containing protein [Burkholderiales bacterium]